MFFYWQVTWGGCNSVILLYFWLCRNAATLLFGFALWMFACCGFCCALCVAGAGLNWLTFCWGIDSCLWCDVLLFRCCSTLNLPFVECFVRCLMFTLCLTVLKIVELLGFIH